MRTLANSEDPDEMAHKAIFHQDLHYLLRQERSSDKYILFGKHYLSLNISEEMLDAPQENCCCFHYINICVKAAYSVTMNIFRKKIFSFQIICKSRIKLCCHNKSYFYSLKLHEKVNYLIKTGVFSLVCNYLRPSNNSRQLIFNINAVVLALIIC